MSQSRTAGSPPMRSTGHGVPGGPLSVNPQLAHHHAGPSSAGGTPSGTASPRPHAPSAYHPRASIVLLGMRGAGKTTLGLIAATALRRRFIDTDSVFETQVHCTIGEYVARHGWAAFRHQEANVLRHTLGRHALDTVIATGGGIVETHEVRELLRATRDECPIILVLREREAVQHYVLGETHSSHPSYGENFLTVLKRREPLFRSCASHTFVSLTAPTSPGEPHPLKLKLIEIELLRLLRFVLSDPVSATPQLIRSPATSRHGSPAPTPGRHSLAHLLAPAPSSRADGLTSPGAPVPFSVPPGASDVTSRTHLLTRRTTFLSLTLPDLRNVSPAKFDEMLQGIDALELRVDLWDALRPASRAMRAGLPSDAPPPEVDFLEVALQVAHARRLARGLPLLFTLRSDREGGSFFDDRDLTHRDARSAHSQALYFALAELGLSMGVELLDVELGWVESGIRSLIARRGRTRIVASYHDMRGDLRWDSELAFQLYDRAARRFGGVDIVEMVGFAKPERPEQNWHLLSFQARVLTRAAQDPARSLPPLMAININEAGRSTRPFNGVLSPVSHPAQLIKAAPGQMSLRDIGRAQISLGLVSPKHYLIGDGPGAHSNAAGNRMRAALDAIGMPPDVRSLSAQELDEMTVREDALRAALSDAHIGGVHLAGHTWAAQVALANALGSANLSMSLASHAVGAVDVVYRGEVASDLVGTSRGALTPHGFCALDGPLSGDHTLASALERVFTRFLSPINVPGASGTALVVAMPLSPSADVHERRGRDVALKAAVCAMARLGYGRCVVVDDGEADGSGSEDSWWGPHVAALVQAEATKLLRAATANVGGANGLASLALAHGHVASGPEATRCAVVRLPRPALADISGALMARAGHPESSHSSANPSGTNTPGMPAAAAHDGPASASATLGSDSPALPRAAAPRHLQVRQPHAVALVGGSDEEQQQALVTLRPDAPSAGTYDAAVLPPQLWATNAGGTLVRVPTSGDAPLYEAAPGARGAPASSSTVHTLEQDALLERSGWLHISPHIVELERLEQGVFEVWTRRRAPRASMRTPAAPTSLA